MLHQDLRLDHIMQTTLGPTKLAGGQAQLTPGNMPRDQDHMVTDIQVSVLLGKVLMRIHRHNQDPRPVNINRAHIRPKVRTLGELQGFPSRIL